MEFLISNDDGVNAPGLKVLAEAMQALGQITVVAPDRDKSGASSSLTLDIPLRINRQLNTFYAVNGTPSDAVHLALTGWLETPPTMVVSGINAGANLGDDVLYSGTVAAAIEGRFLGFPAIAISLANKTRNYQFYATAAEITKRLVKQLVSFPLPQNTILNVNVPDLPLEKLKGIQVTRLGQRHMAEKMLPATDPRGHPIYWIGPVGKEQDAGPGTDFHAINQGYVSITPLKIDLTDKSFLAPLAQWAQSLSLAL